MSPFTELQRPARVAATLCCFPHAGGTSAMFRRHPVPPDVLLLGVDLPGRARRFGETPFTTMDEVLGELLHERHRLRPPYILFGHSLGAIIAFELACALERLGDGPTHVVVSGRQPPHVAESQSAISTLSDDALVEQLRGYGGIPPGALAEPGLMELLLPAIRGDFTIAESYQYSHSPPIRADLTALGATDDDTFDAATLELWGPHTAGTFEMHRFTGGHFFINEIHASEMLMSIATRVAAWHSRGNPQKEPVP